MLLSIVFELEAAQPGCLPSYLGRANQAQLMAWLDESDHELAVALHEASQLRPLTCSSLLYAQREGDQAIIEVGRTYAVRFTCLHPDVSARIDRCLRTCPPRTWKLHNYPFKVAAIYCDHERNSWSGMTSYEELARHHLLVDAKSPRKVTLEFASPTAFKSQEMMVPIPMPGLAFGSLFDRWNAFSPIQIPDDMRAFGESAVAVSHYQLHTETLQHKRKSIMIGAVGRVTYTALGGDRYWLAVMNLLADFALYSGVGVKTTSGLGQVRRR